MASTTRFRGPGNPPLARRAPFIRPSRRPRTSATKKISSRRWRLFFVTKNKLLGDQETLLAPRNMGLVTRTWLLGEEENFLAPRNVFSDPSGLINTYDANPTLWPSSDFLVLCGEGRPWSQHSSGL
jgi:hypothetical protein